METAVVPTKTSCTKKTFELFYMFGRKPFTEYVQAYLLKSMLDKKKCYNIYT